MKRRFLFSLFAILALVTMLLPISGRVAQAAQGTLLPGKNIPKFVDPLPLLDLTASGTLGIDTLVAGAAEIELHMREFQANVMPSTFVPATGTYTGT